MAPVFLLVLRVLLKFFLFFFFLFFFFFFLCFPLSFKFFLSNSNHLLIFLVFFSSSAPMPASKRSLSEVDATTQPESVKKLKEEVIDGEKKAKKDKKDKTEKKDKKDKSEKSEKKEKKEKKSKKDKETSSAAASEVNTPEDTSSETGSVAESDPNALENFRISQPTMDNMRAAGIKALFPIQSMTFDHVYDGKDVIGQAKTGSGKTISFGLPIIEKLLKNPPQGRGRPPVVIVMAPTRELAKQVRFASLL